MYVRVSACVRVCVCACVRVCVCACERISRVRESGGRGSKSEMKLSDASLCCLLTSNFRAGNQKYFSFKYRNNPIEQNNLN